MQQMKLWDSNECRCCLKSVETNVFHIIECLHQYIIKQKEQVFDKIFSYAISLDIDEEIL